MSEQAQTFKIAADGVGREVVEAARRSRTARDGRVNRLVTATDRWECLRLPPSSPP